MLFLSWSCLLFFIVKDRNFIHAIKIPRKRYYGSPDKLKYYLESYVSRENHTFESCSLERSSLVKQLLDKDFFPIFQSYGKSVSESCPFNPDNGVYGIIQAKKTYTGSYYKCEICGKQFVSDFFLNKHMQNRHPEFSQPTNKYCLSDFCDIFRCDLHIRYPIVSSQQPACVDKQVRVLQHKCQNIMKSCMVSDNHLLYDALYYSICSSLTCNHFYTQFEDLSAWTVFLIAVGVPVALFVCIFLVWYICEEVGNMGEPTSPKKSRRRRENEITYAYDYTGRFTQYSDTIRQRRRDRPETLYSRDRNNVRIYPINSVQQSDARKTKFSLSPVLSESTTNNYNKQSPKNSNGVVVRQFGGASTSTDTPHKVAWSFPKESLSPHLTKHLSSPANELAIQIL